MYSFTAKYEGEVDFNEKVVGRLRRNLITAVTRFGKMASGSGAIGLARHLKTAGGYPQNNPIWQWTKGGKRLFYDTGAWRNMPSFKVHPGTGNILVAVEVGFVDKKSIKGGSRSSTGSMNSQSLASRMTSGASWTPTAKQKKAFWAKAVAAVGAQYKLPKGDYSQVQWNQPKRDFISRHMKSPKVVSKFVEAIDIASKRTFRIK